MFLNRMDLAFLGLMRPTSSIEKPACMKKTIWALMRR